MSSDGCVLSIAILSVVFSVNDDDDCDDDVDDCDVVFPVFVAAFIRLCVCMYMYADMCGYVCVMTMLMLMMCVG